MQCWHSSLKMPLGNQGLSDTILRPWLLSSFSPTNAKSKGRSLGKAERQSTKGKEETLHRSVPRDTVYIWLNQEWGIGPCLVARRLRTSHVGTGAKVQLSVGRDELGVQLATISICCTRPEGDSQENTNEVASYSPDTPNIVQLT